MEAAPHLPNGKPVQSAGGGSRYRPDCMTIRGDAPTGKAAPARPENVDHSRRAHARNGDLPTRYAQAKIRFLKHFAAHLINPESGLI